MNKMIEHPEIGYIQRTGYPSCFREGADREEIDEDAAFEERREAEHGW